jgi:hypothetical protein
MLRRKYRKVKQLVRNLSWVHPNDAMALAADRPIWLDRFDRSRKKRNK